MTTIDWLHDITIERDNWRNKVHAHQVAMSQAEDEIKRLINLGGAYFSELQDYGRTVTRLNAEIERLTKRCEDLAAANVAANESILALETDNTYLKRRCEEARKLFTPMTSGIVAWAEYMDRRDRWLEGKP